MFFENTHKSYTQHYRFLNGMFCRNTQKSYTQHYRFLNGMFFENTHKINIHILLRLDRTY